MKLPQAAYLWAMNHLETEGDSDLFPRLVELDALFAAKKQVLAALKDVDVGNHPWSPGRRFMVPKGNLGFRAATQLEPLDSLILAALVKKYGAKIESGRVAAERGTVFSNRFSPTKDGRFYGNDSGWRAFWTASAARAASSQWVAMADISDFYGQIYHHTLENELGRSRVPAPVTKAILRCIGALSHGVSRGLPVGPHSAHLLAEAALTPVDESLHTRGAPYCRYVDDFHFFCSDRGEGEQRLYEFADIVNKQQRLMLQERKTRVLESSEFLELARQMLDDQPMSDEERELIEMIRGHTSDDPYATEDLSVLTDEELEVVDQDTVEALLDVYFATNPVNYPRLGWLLRRLSQMGAPGAVDYVVRRVAAFTPILGDAARYLFRATPNYPGTMEDLGAHISTAMQLPQVRGNTYAQMVLVGLVARSPGLDHAEALLQRYEGARPEVRRELILLAGAMGYGHWVREHKDDFASADPWTRRALLYSARALPGDEAQFWLKRVQASMEPLDKFVANFALAADGKGLGGLKFE